MDPLLLKHPIRESEATRLILAIRQIFEELGDDLSFGITALVQYDV